MSEDRAQQALQKRLNACLKKQENIVCCECPSRLPRWASMNLGIFICTNCSGIHRSLGVHISRVRSTQLDKWTEQQVDFMERMGNERANAYWEKNLPANVKPQKSDLQTVEKFIRQKYERKMFCDKNSDGPIPLSSKAEAEEVVVVEEYHNHHHDNNNNRISAQTTTQRGTALFVQQKSTTAAAAGLLDLFGNAPPLAQPQPQQPQQLQNNGAGTNWMDFGNAPLSTNTARVQQAVAADDDWGDFSSAATPPPATKVANNNGQHTQSTSMSAAPPIDMFAGFDVVAQPLQATKANENAQQQQTTKKIVASKDDIMGLFDAAPPVMLQQPPPQHQNMMMGMPQMGMGMGGGMPPPPPQMMMNSSVGGMMGGGGGGGYMQQQYPSQNNMYAQPQMYQPQQQPPQQMFAQPGLNNNNMYMMQQNYQQQQPQQQHMMYNNHQQQQQLNPNAPRPISLDTFGGGLQPPAAHDTSKKDLFPDLKW